MFQLVGKTIRELARPRLVLVLIVATVLFWLAVCVQYKLSSWDASLRFWSLDEVWRLRVEHSRQWHHEYLEKHGRAWVWQEQREIAAYSTWHTQTIGESQMTAWLAIFPALALISTSMLMDRLFRRGEISLILTRPVDSSQLFWSQFIGIYAVFGAATALTAIPVLWGGFGEGWREALPMVGLALRTQLSLLAALIALPLFFAPLIGSFLRGAGTFLASAGVAIAAALIPANPTLLGGLIPQTFGRSDTLYYKTSMVLQNVFLAPIPRLSHAVRGFTSAVEESGRYFWGLDNAILDSAGYWWWTATNGLIVLLVAAALWSRREIR